MINGGSNQRKRCAKGMHAFGQPKYVSSIKHGLVQVEKQKCVYCGKLKSPKQ